LGLIIRDGKLTFDSFLLDPVELLTEPAVFSWLSVTGSEEQLELGAATLAYTVCQVPVVIRVSPAVGIDVHLADGSMQHLPELTVDAANSRHVFQRDGHVHHLVVSISVDGR